MYISLTYKHIYLNTWAFVVTFTVWRPLQSFSPLALLSSLSCLSSMQPCSSLPGEPLNPGEEYIVSTCLSSHTHWQQTDLGSSLFTLIELCYSAHYSHLLSFLSLYEARHRHDNDGCVRVHVQINACFQSKKVFHCFSVCVCVCERQREAERIPFLWSCFCLSNECDANGRVLYLYRLLKVITGIFGFKVQTKIFIANIQLCAQYNTKGIFIFITKKFVLLLGRKSIRY